jgi:hypothetical protein
MTKNKTNINHTNNTIHTNQPHQHQQQHTTKTFVEQRGTAGKGATAAFGRGGYSGPVPLSAERGHSIGARAAATSSDTRLAFGAALAKMDWRLSKLIHGAFIGLGAFESDLGPLTLNQAFSSGGALRAAFERWCGDNGLALDEELVEVLNVSVDEDLLVVSAIAGHALLRYHNSSSGFFVDNGDAAKVLQDLWGLDSELAAVVFASFKIADYVYPRGAKSLLDEMPTSAHALAVKVNAFAARAQQALQTTPGWPLLTEFVDTFRAEFESHMTLPWRDAELAALTFVMSLLALPPLWRPACLKEYKANVRDNKTLQSRAFAEFGAVLLDYDTMPPDELVAEPTSTHNFGVCRDVFACAMLYATPSLAVRGRDAALRLPELAAARIEAGGDGLLAEALAFVALLRSSDGSAEFAYRLVKRARLGTIAAGARDDLLTGLNQRLADAQSADRLFWQHLPKVATKDSIGGCIVSLSATALADGIEREANLANLNATDTRAAAAMAMLKV